MDVNTNTEETPSAEVVPQLLMVFDARESLSVAWEKAKIDTYLSALVLSGVSFRIPYLAGQS